MWFEWLFKYPRQAYAQGELAFAGDFGALWWGAAVVLLTLGIVFGRRVARFTVLRRASVYVLQIAAIAVLLTIIAEPVLEVTRLAPGANTVAVLVDTSESMALPARAADDESRLAVAKRLVGDEIEAASGGSRVALFHFDDALRQADTVADLQAEGDRSRLLESLADLATHYDQGALAAVIVVTDGAHNGSRVGWEALAETGIPVHSIGIGPADIPGDVEMAELVLPSRASPHTQVAAHLVIRHSSRTAGEEIRLRVLDGESVLAAESITLDPSSPTIAADIVFPSGGSGLKDVTVALEAPSDDPLPGNNVQSVLLDVDRKRYRVLYLEGEPRWSSSSFAGPRPRTTTSNSSPGFAPRPARPTARERRTRTNWPTAFRTPSKPSTATTWSSSAACPPHRSTTNSTTGWLASSPNAVADCSPSRVAMHWTTADGTSSPWPRRCRSWSRDPTDGHTDAATTKYVRRTRACAPC